MEKFSAHFLQHHWKSQLLTGSREGVWACPPPNYIVVSADWSSNYQRVCPVELTCEGGSSSSRNCILCPIIVQRCIKPVTDPLLKDMPEIKLQVEKEGLTSEDTLYVLEGYVFVSSVVTDKGPATLRYFINTIVDGYKAAGVPLPSGVILDTDNCSAQYKSGKALRSIRYIGQDNEMDVATLNNVPDHGKSLSDGWGGYIKWVFDRASSGLNPEIDMALPHTQFGAALAAYGNTHLSKSCETPWKSQGLAKKVVYRRFFHFAEDIYTRYAVADCTFPKQADGMGVMRGVRDLFSFRYSFSSDSLYFRNLFCACHGCLQLDYGTCTQKEYVAPWKLARFVEKVQSGSASGAEDFNEDASSEDDCDDHAELDAVDALCAGDIISVTGEPDPKYPIWLASVTGPVYYLTEDLFEPLTKTTYHKGSRVIPAFWLEYALGLDKGPDAPDRIFKVARETPAIILSHLYGANIDTQEVRSSRGRAVNHVVKVSQEEICRAAALVA
jgi:hypothetical protein